MWDSDHQTERSFLSILTKFKPTPFAYVAPQHGRQRSPNWTWLTANSCQIQMHHKNHPQDTVSTTHYAVWAYSNPRNLQTSPWAYIAPLQSETVITKLLNVAYSELLPNSSRLNQSNAAQVSTTWHIPSTLSTFGAMMHAPRPTAKGEKEREAGGELDATRPWKRRQWPGAPKKAFPWLQEAFRMPFSLSLVFHLFHPFFFTFCVVYSEWTFMRSNVKRQSRTNVRVYQMFINVELFIIKFLKSRDFHEAHFVFYSDHPPTWFLYHVPIFRDKFQILYVCGLQLYPSLRSSILVHSLSWNSTRFSAFFLKIFT